MFAQWCDGVRLRISEAIGSSMRRLWPASRDDRHADRRAGLGHALRRHVLVPLMPRCIDEEYGGFLVDFDDRWRPAGPQDKSLEHAARTTIAFAEIDRAMPGQGYERSRAPRLRIPAAGNVGRRAWRLLRAGRSERTAAMGGVRSTRTR